MKRSGEEAAPEGESGRGGLGNSAIWLIFICLSPALSYPEKLDTVCSVAYTYAYNSYLEANMTQLSHCCHIGAVSVAISSLFW